MGPTASGKSAWAVRLARRLRPKVRCEIISADSVMVYRGLDIGTAKPPMGARAEVPHHLIDVCAPCEAYSVAEFRRDALALIQSMHARGIMPLVVGGSMLYFYVLRYGITPTPPADASLRASLLEQAHACGWEEMHRLLTKVDPETASRIHPLHNTRILRALEVYHSGGIPLSKLRTRCLPGMEQLGMATRYVALLPARWPITANERRDDRYWRAFDGRLRRRIDAMLDAGLVRECARSLAIIAKNTANRATPLPATRAVGYKQILDYLGERNTSAYDDVADNQDALALLAERILSATRRTVRSQLNWLSRFPGLRRIVLARLAC